MPAVTSTKQSTGLPYATNGNLLPIVKNANQSTPANPTQADLEQGNRNVMGTAQNVAQQSAAGSRTGTMGLVEAQTQGVLLNPMGPKYNPERQKQLQLEQFDRNRANAMAGMQQQTADVSNTGANLEKAYNFAMKGAQDRTDLEGKIDYEQNATERKAMIEALGLGQDVAKTQSGLDSEAVNRLINTRQGFEGERAQESEQGWKTSEREASQDWQTSERVDNARITEHMKNVDAEIAKAAAAQNFEYQKYLEEVKGNLQLKMQTNEMNQEEKMAYLGAQLAEAKANNDVNRQKQILTFQYEQDLNKMEKEFGYEAALQDLRSKAEMAIKQGDWTNAQVLQKLQIEAAAREHDKDLVVQRAKLDLEQAGVDMARFEQQFNFLQQEVEAGRIDPATLSSFVGGVLSKAGVKVIPPDPMATQKAADKQYEDMLYQFKLTHPGLVQESLIPNPNFGKVPGADRWLPGTTLTDTGVAKFNEFMNSTLYGELTAEQRKEKENAGYLSAADLGGAGAGDKFNIEEETTYNGLTIPPGKYTTSEEVQQFKGSFDSGAYSKTHTVITNVETGEKFTIKSAKSAKSKSDAEKLTSHLLNPFNF